MTLVARLGEQRTFTLARKGGTGGPDVTAFSASSGELAWWRTVPRCYSGTYELHFITHSCYHRRSTRLRFVNSPTLSAKNADKDEAPSRLHWIVYNFADFDRSGILVGDAKD